MQPATHPSARRRLRVARRRSQRGQVMVETAIIMPIMVFTILGAVQLVLLQHARVMTEYAAYCAARAGVVNNANWNVMRNAALLGALPVYQRTDTWEHFFFSWGKMKLLTEATELVDTTAGTVETAVDDLLGMIGLGGVSVSGFMPDVSLVEVDVTSPVQEDFLEGRNWQNARESDALSVDQAGPLRYPDEELDFDSRGLIRQEPRTGRLAVEVRLLVPLKVPVINWIFFQLWYAQEELRMASLRSNLTQWANLEAELAGGGTLEDAVRNTEGRQVFDDALLTQQRTKEARLLRNVATGAGVYLMPMRASYAMQMQSNPFWDNRRQPVWFSLGD